MGYAPCENQQVIYRDPLEHTYGPAHYGLMQPQSDVLPVFTFGQQGRNLGFGKNRTHAIDLDLFSGLQGLLSKPVQAITEALGHDLKEFPCPCRAAVVHFKLGHSAFIVDNSVYLSPGHASGLERLAQYILRCPVSLARVVRLTADGSVIYRAEQDSVNCRSCA